MKKKDSSENRLAVSFGLVLAGILGRLIPHPVNFTPVGGISLFAGTRVGGWQAFMIPVTVMLVTNPIMGKVLGFPAFDSVTPFVYASLLINVAIGRFLLPSRRPIRIAGMALLCSCQFFVITNFGIWASGAFFPLTGSGLVACYLGAIPYFGRTIMADLFYAGLLFRLDSWLVRKFHPSDRRGWMNEKDMALVE